MGYAVLHLDKAPGNEAAMTAHIARTKIPTNASPERTCLNEELVEFPEEVADRTEAINYRLEHAGLTRKIGTNQVRVIRVMLTGSHDTMKRIEEEGRLPEWCADNLAWLRETFGAENVVSAVVHRDESTPHIHAAVVPIVTGERRKARTAASETPGKRHYRPKSAARPRLCADDVMSRIRLKQYQDTYAAAMSKYGLERGIDGSEARHITTQEFYRQAIAQQQDLQENIDALLRLEEQKRKAVEQLKQQERQVRTEYEQTATLQAQKSAELNRTEAELQIGTLNRTNREEKARHEQAEQQLQAKLDRIEHWLPDTQTLISWGEYCRDMGLLESGAREIIAMKPLYVSGELRAPEYSRRFDVSNTEIRLQRDPNGPGGFQLLIDRQPAHAWFRQRYVELMTRLGYPVRPERPVIRRHTIER
ncbi:MAG: plasmid recombination protein [Alistipes sp.]|nr:plasmid recombination protein [Alistipes sp.]